MAFLRFAVINHSLSLRAPLTGKPVFRASLYSTIQSSSPPRVLRFVILAQASIQPEVGSVRPWTRRG